MSLSNDNEYYMYKAHKYFTKYEQLKQSKNILKGGMRQSSKDSPVRSKPLWFNNLVEETKVIYDSLSAISNTADEPKKTIILSGSAALALLLGSAEMYTELYKAFNSDENTKPNDLDFIYQGSTKNDNLNITSITTMIQPIYKRIQETAISSPKYVLTTPIIRDFDLTNVNTNHKDMPFIKLPYINIYGIKVLTPDKLLSYYNDESLEKNINKIEQLTGFIEIIESNSELKDRYSRFIKDDRYVPQTSVVGTSFRSSAMRLFGDELPRKVPSFSFDD